MGLLAFKPKDATPLGLPGDIKKGISGLSRPADDGEADPMNAQAHAAFNQAQAGLTKEAPQIEQEAMSTVDASQPIGAGLEQAAKPLAFGGPETSQALENLGQSRYKDDIQKLRIKTRDASRKQASANQAKAFENLIEKNKLAQQAHARRMERKQARYAAKMGVVSALMQAGGMMVGGMAGASAAGAAGPKPGAGQGSMIGGQPTASNEGIA